MASPIPIGKQDEILAKIAGTQLAINAQMCGALDAPHVLRFKRAVEEFKTQDEDTKKLKENAVKLSARNEPVLITGESGTGKELIARILHGERTGEFVDINSCSMVETLFESELFGHLRGSFTGAMTTRQGLIAQAQHGTLFFDEIGDLPLCLQAKLLRVIQFREFRQVGDNKIQKVECRIVAATNVNLRQMIRDKLFRLDLYERLNVFNLHIKPLRDRWGDVLLHASEELAMFLGEHKAQLSGNVRQLQNLKLKMEVLGRQSISEQDIL